MRVIGVVDLLGGQAVHARAGERESYAPVRVVAGAPIPPGDGLALARAYLDRFELTELYTADLDAILGRAPQDTLIEGLVALGAPLWLDAGVSSVDPAFYALGLGAARVVVGLETLASYDALGRICAAVGGDRVAFSLDLRGGEPVVGSAAMPPGQPADVVAARAASAGPRALIVIDLARVGTGMGPDFGLIAQVREAAPGLILVAGGGVRGLEDLARLADCGCDGVLVATALHTGRLGPADVAAARRLGRLDGDR